VTWRPTIAVDFDGVLHSYTTPWLDETTIPDPPVEGAIEWLTAMAADFDVAIFTTRAKTRAGALAVSRWLNEHGFAGVVTISDRKPMAVIYVDDRGWRFEGPGTFPTAEQIHAAVPWNRRRA
jgi:hypothetical protein